jgi:hypothetical protein
MHVLRAGNRGQHCLATALLAASVAVVREEHPPKKPVDTWPKAGEGLTLAKLRKACDYLDAATNDHYRERERHPNGRKDFGMGRNK